MPVAHVKRGATKRQRQRVVAKNIKAEVDSWKKTHRIGTSHPKTKKQAVRQAIAVAESEADRDMARSRKSKKRGKH